MMTDGERTLVLDKAKKYLRDAGFDNVVILTNEGGSHGTIGIACYTKPALMRLLMASYFMDDAMCHTVKDDSLGRVLWKNLLHSILKTIVPQIRKMENEMKEEGKNEA
ncbi:hypothetical protein [Dialister succinatiphilus]|uniref:hypothetical protein n=1 Tax=Dialister succinatiphilus TaxID=487173 RepID=UPI003F7D3A8E